MVEGCSIITYKNKTIIYFDYTNIGGNRQKTLDLIKEGAEEYIKYAKVHGEHSILALTNVTNLKFDMEILGLFKENNNKCKNLYKKLALVGVKGLLKAGYNFVVGLTDQTTKAFESETEAKEWLVS